MMEASTEFGCALEWVIHTEHKLDGEDCRWAIGGAVALQLHGLERATKDVDRHRIDQVLEDCREPQARERDLLADDRRQVPGMQMEEDETRETTVSPNMCRYPPPQILTRM